MELKDFLEKVKTVLPERVNEGYGICSAIVRVAVFYFDEHGIVETEKEARKLLRSQKVIREAMKMGNLTNNVGEISYLWFYQYELNNRLALVDYMISICEEK